MHDERPLNRDDGDPGDSHEARARQQLVSLLGARGIADERVLAAMAAVERHRYLEEQWSEKGL